MWKTLNFLAGKSKQLEPTIKIEIDGKIVSEGTVVANKFNNFFSNIGPQLASTIPSNRDVNRFNTLTPIPDSIFMEPATKQEVILKIKNLDQNKSAGPDGLQANFIKHHHQIFSELIRDVFNESLENGKYPSCLKTARVIPIHKGGSKTDVNNYRPISILSVISKILEQML
ncbi:uncharacterized protein LOC129759372, partial [Uranotaenia lowii]|uniref:uncharacterized protein LOC129759372 n=1 Tax=Uranotaenia lowii TaxID=190385 RepID=UPI00247944ED